MQHEETDVAQDLVEWITLELERDHALSDEVRYIVLGALSGDSGLDEALEENTRPGRVIDTTTDSAPAAVGQFLKSITVAGFRGIGPEVRLSLSPSPGLVIVAGRNGSGKSSFAEALELALTGATYRWAKKAANWRTTWRNLHRPSPTQIRVELAGGGNAKATIGVDWTDGADLDAHTTWLQRNGGSREVGLSSLGWAGPLDAYRPLLSYEELGGLLEAGPSKLYDELAKILNLEQITDGIKRLTSRSKTLDQPAADLKKLTQELRDECSSVSDERAVATAGELFKRVPDLEALRELATGSALPASGRLERLRRLATIAVTPALQRSDAARELRLSVETFVMMGEGEATKTSLQRSVIRAALELQAAHGDGDCPVCGVGRMNASWAVHARAAIEADIERETAFAAARRRLQRARAQAQALLLPIPATLDEVIDEPTLTSLLDARAAWQAWATPPEADLELADKLTTGTAMLSEKLMRLNAEAEQSMRDLDDVWAPLAVRVATWVEHAQTAGSLKATADRVRTARDWLKTNDKVLKNDRIRVVADQARQIWADLRQESNVDLGELKLSGANTSRRVEITATVDGEHAGALSVMSQGELHALALALFIPRATMPDSPFRFVVLDDPVQAMDPAKVNGLIKVLSKAAELRQVIVFSHDDRLADAARRGPGNARILEVTRGADSEVSVSNLSDPSKRYLDDAWAICADDGLPDATLRRTLPGLLRLAVEASARETYFGAEYSAGKSVDTVEETWRRSRTTAPRVSLGLFREVRSLDQWLDRAGYRKRGLGICTSGAHNGLSGDPREAIDDVQRLVADITGAKK
jgi:recombinational DNA repair ATPase RecF